MNIRPYQPADWQRLCEIHDPALELYKSLGFVIKEKKSGKMTGNESYEATAYILERTSDGKATDQP